MICSPEIGALATALAKAQAMMEAAKRDSVNPHYHSKYADFASVVEAVRKPFAAHGLSFVQLPLQTEAEEIAVETVLLHASGQWVSSVFAIPVARADAHGCMSALTYCRRGGLASMAGVAADDDDDGNAANVTPPARQQTAAPASNRCPVCGVDAILKSKPPRTGWYCFTRRGGCGTNWPEGPFPTERPADLAKPGIVSEDQAAEEAARLFPTSSEQAERAEDERQERAALLSTIRAQADLKRIPQRERTVLWTKHCRTATPENADLSALSALLEELSA